MVTGQSLDTCNQVKRLLMIIPGLTPSNLALGSLNTRMIEELKQGLGRPRLSDETTDRAI